MEATCKNCGTPYHFKKRWFNTHNHLEFICRKCKVIKATTSEQFKEKQRRQSILKLSLESVKNLMSTKAVINNMKNAEKISKSLKKHFKSAIARKEDSQNIATKWKDNDFKSKISMAIKLKWKDPLYRNKILGNRVLKSIKRSFKKNPKDHQKIKTILDNNNTKYQEYFDIHIYKFNFFIDGKYLLDLDYSKEKEEFVNHYFKGKYVYINSLKQIR